MQANPFSFFVLAIDVPSSEITFRIASLAAEAIRWLSGSINLTVSGVN